MINNGQVPDIRIPRVKPGDPVMGLKLDHGGHLTHGSPVNISGRFYNFVPYKVTPSDERIDYDQIRDLAHANKPKMIVAGATAYPRIIDPEPLRAIADEVGALLMFDAARNSERRGLRMEYSLPYGQIPDRSCVRLCPAALHSPAKLHDRNPVAA